MKGCGFFHDNEYFGDRVCGYTLPGFLMRPYVEWTVNEHVVLEVGGNWRHYWGAHNYPLATFDTPWPARSDTTTATHLLPWVQFRANWGDWDEGGSLVLGSGSLDFDHNLPLPLYNPERLFATDPEAGIRLGYWNEWFEAEAWCDWRDYIWANSNTKERFTAGLRVKPTLTFLYSCTDWTFHIPIHFVGQHIGGQGLTTWSPVQNMFNASVGITAYRDWYTSGLKFECFAMGFSQKGNAAVPFNRGWGLYPEVLYFHKFKHDSQLYLVTGYWYGEGFVPLLGSWHFSNLSAVTPGLTYDRNRVVTARVQYRPICGTKSNLKIEAGVYQYLPTQGSDGDLHPAQTQYSLGCYLYLWPSIRLR